MKCHTIEPTSNLLQKVQTYLNYSIVSPQNFKLIEQVDLAIIIKIKWRDNSIFR